MRKATVYAILLAAALMACGCAKEATASKYGDAKRFFDAWVHTHYEAGALDTLGLGVYSIKADESKGSGDEFADSMFIFADVTIRELGGTVKSTTSEELSKQLGKYDETYQYGPRPMQLGDEAQMVGIEQALEGMKLGGTRKVIIPRWLMSTKRFDILEQYLDNDKGGDTDYIYEFTVTDATSDMVKHNIREIEAYNDRMFGGLDSLSYCFYYKRLAEPESEKTFPDDTTIYINYTGRLLSGQVFDTTIKDTAKVHHIYNASKSYAPVKITFADEDNEIQLGTSKGLVTGFTNTLRQLHPMEKGVGIFTYDLGYGAAGTGSIIPPYAALVFEIEAVKGSN